jgi:glycine betaine/proline transport system ATP-binding protein
MSPEVIVLKNVWKIFGRRAEEALRAIQAQGLSKQEVFDRFGCVVGVADANITVRKSEIFCVMGLSGSGKSTLVRHINRLLDPTAGEIFVDGENIMRKSAKELRLLRARKIGMVFQNVALLPHRSVRDNVALPLEIQGISKNRRYEIAEKSIALVGLAGWGDRLCHELSGGMQQRVGLARAMAADPVIMLMDEPFSALDPLIRTQLQDQFVQLSESMGKTTVFITHDLDEAIRIGDRIAIMKDGVIVQVGTPEEIVSAPADEYVADFVANISRLKLVSAHRIMEPIDAFRGRCGPGIDASACPRVRADCKLGEVIDIATETDDPIVVVDGAGRDIGVIDKCRLLKGIKEGKSA